MVYRTLNISVPNIEKVNCNTWGKVENMLRCKKLSILLTTISLFSVLIIVFLFFESTDERVEWARQFDIDAFETSTY
jgi:hypothetical protein